MDPGQYMDPENSAKTASESGHVHRMHITTGHFSMPVRQLCTLLDHDSLLKVGGCLES